MGEIEQKSTVVWAPLDEDEDLKDPFDDFRQVQTMYGGTAFMVSRYLAGEVVYLPKGYAICKIGEGESDTKIMV